MGWGIRYKFRSTEEVKPFDLQRAPVPHVGSKVKFVWWNDKEKQPIEVTGRAEDVLIDYVKHEIVVDLLVF